MNVKLFVFDNDDAFEDYMLAHDQWVGWSLIQNHVVLNKHRVIGMLNDAEELVAVASVTAIPNDEFIFINLFQVRDDLQMKGYGREFFKRLEQRYLPKYAGFKLQYLQSALGFWLKQGFSFDKGERMLVR